MTTLPGTATIGDDARLRPADKVLFRALGGEAVLLDVGAGTYFGLDEVGTRVWRLLAGGASLAAALAALEAEYDVSAERLARDVRALVEELVAARLLVVEAG